MVEVEAKLIKQKNIAAEVVRFTFEVPASFSSSPGQFVMLKFEKKGEIKQRAYSILTHVPGKMELAVKLIPGGFGSEILRKSKMGDRFTLRGPFDHFLLANHNPKKEIWMLCTGVGIVPFYNMLNDFVPKYPQQQFKLIYSEKTKADLILHLNFLALAKKNPNFKYVPTLTREKWAGATGRVGEHLGNNFKNKIFYLCGVKEFVEATKTFLMDKGVASKDIKF